jgi:transposase InsO family protein
MKEEQKKEIATFRFNVISDLVMENCLDEKELRALIKQKASRRWRIPYSDRTTISETTIRRWIKAYEQENRNIKALYPKNRVDAGGNRSIGEEAAIILLDVKRFAPGVPVTELYRDLKQSGLLPLKAIPSLSTIYRFFRTHKEIENTIQKTDRRRFEAEFPNDIWQSDVMHGPKLKIEGRMRKTYLIAFIDDHSRIIPGAAFYLQENLKCFLKALKGALMARGIPRKIYVDNGPAFRSKQLEFIMASLMISLVHAKPYSPQGKGKIERFFRTVRSSFLSEKLLDEIKRTNNPLMELNERLSVWIADRYHRQDHSSIGSPPLKRFADGIEMVRPAPDNLLDHFRQVSIRTVTKDRIVNLDGKMFEAPVDLISERVELLYHDDDPTEIEVRFNRKSYGLLKPVDLGVNVRAKREKSEDITTLESHNESRKPLSGRLFTKKGGYDHE